MGLPVELPRSTVPIIEVSLNTAELVLLLRCVRNFLAEMIDLDPLSPWGMLGCKLIEKLCSEDE
jgi:hypothetical protein